MSIQQHYRSYRAKLADLVLFLRLDVFPEDVAQHGALAVVLQELFHRVYCSTLPSPSGEGQSVGSGTKRQQR